MLMLSLFFWIASRIRGMGGCNDLILSGHCIIYAVVQIAAA